MTPPGRPPGPTNCSHCATRLLPVQGSPSTLKCPACAREFPATETRERKGCLVGGCGGTVSRQSRYQLCRRHSASYAWERRRKGVRAEKPESWAALQSTLHHAATPAVAAKGASLEGSAANPGPEANPALPSVTLILTPALVDFIWGAASWDDKLAFIAWFGERCHSLGTRNPGRETPL